MVLTMYSWRLCAKNQLTIVKWAYIAWGNTSSNAFTTTSLPYSPWVHMWRCARACCSSDLCITDAHLTGRWLSHLLLNRCVSSDRSSHEQCDRGQPFHMYVGIMATCSYNTVIVVLLTYFAAIRRFPSFGFRSLDGDVLLSGKHKVRTHPSHCLTLSGWVADLFLSDRKTLLQRLALFLLVFEKLWDLCFPKQGTGHDGTCISHVPPSSRGSRGGKKTCSDVIGVRLTCRFT